MAGPILTAWLPEPLTTDQVYELDDWLISISDAIKGVVGHREIWPAPILLGLPDEIPCLTLVDIDGPGPDILGVSRMTDMEQRALNGALGFAPQQAVTVAAMCNWPIYHRVTAIIAMHVAREYGGIIDFGGTLVPNRAEASKPEAIHDYLAAFPGTLIEMMDEGPAEHRRGFPSHLGDATFMEAWLRAPDFYLIK